MFLNAEQKEIQMHPESDCPGGDECSALQETVRVSEQTFCGYTLDMLYALESERDLFRDELAAIAPALREAAALAFKKSQDYGDPDWSRRSYFPFGHQSYLQMLHTKMERLKSVAAKGSANFESARDSALDLINYASFYVAWMDEQKRADDTAVHAAVHEEVLTDFRGVRYKMTVPCSLGLGKPCSPDLLAEDGMLPPKAEDFDTEAERQTKANAEAVRRRAEGAGHE